MNNTQSIIVDDLDSMGQETLNVVTVPNECSICGHKISPQNHGGIVRKVKYNREARLIFLCPDNNCKELFIGYYTEYDSPRQGSRFELQRSEPKKVKPVEFSDIIENVSPTFAIIYNQAHTAEEKDLKDICGAGYRKALEFLIKDYLISNDKKQEEKVKKEPLGTVIKNRVGHEQLKEVSKRAVWLGNDETHYERRWGDKDLKDLKILINLSVRWIEMEKMTEQAKKDMPETKVN